MFTSVLKDRLDNIQKGFPFFKVVRVVQSKTNSCFNLKLNRCICGWQTLISQRWLKPSSNHIINCINFTLLGLMQCKKEFYLGEVKLRTLFLKTVRPPEFRISKSNIFNCFTVVGKKSFWNINDKFYIEECLLSCSMHTSSPKA